MAFWTCPACSRRVPGYAPLCHCGARRESATALAARPLSRATRSGPARFDWRDLTLPVWAALGVMVIALCIAAWRLAQPLTPNKLPALLGYADPPWPPSPSPPPAARRAPALQ